MDAELRAAVDQFTAASAEVLTNANRPQFSTSLRKLYLAREALRSKAEELNAKLEAAKQGLQLAEAERTAAAEAALKAEAERAAQPQPQPQPQQPLEEAATPLSDLEAPPLQGVGSLPDGLPSFDLGLNSMDIDFKF